MKATSTINDGYIIKDIIVSDYQYQLAKTQAPELNKLITNKMKATKWDYDYLIDQLSNSMEFYNSKDDFVAEVSAETKFSAAVLSVIWDRYTALDGKTAFEKSNYDWYDFIKAIDNES